MINTYKSIHEEFLDFILSLEKTSWIDVQDFSYQFHDIYHKTWQYCEGYDKKQCRITDSEGSLLFGDTLMLNNYDQDAFETKTLKSICAFVSINLKGIVRFTEVSLDLEAKKLLVTRDYTYQLPFEITDLEWFGGKRGGRFFYDEGNIGIRCMDSKIYNLCPDDIKGLENKPMLYIGEKYLVKKHG